MSPNKEWFSKFKVLSVIGVPIGVLPIITCWFFVKSFSSAASGIKLSVKGVSIPPLFNLEFSCLVSREN